MPSSPSPFVVAGRFEVNDPEQALLGRGGMGNVYKGVDRQTGQPVAIKVLKPEIVVGYPEMVERFIREGEALRQLNHPNIVKVITAEEEAGRHYLVMEYVGGGSLYERLAKHGPLPINQAVEIALDLSDALTRAHRLDILHRDLKPANVLLAEDGTPRLSDFGVARLSSGGGLTQAGMIVGTLAYLSPEACEGEILDARSDIWAFGVLLFEMLTGRQPFTGQSFNSTLVSILREPTPFLADLRPDVPDPLADLIYRMLAKDPRERISSVRLVGAELEQLLQQTWGQEGKDAPPTLTPTPQPIGSLTPSRRHNLPYQTTPFVGRLEESATLSKLLADPSIRLVTIVGAGGMGKTRLALAVAEAQVGKYEHGVYFISLAFLETVENLFPAIARALNFTFTEGREPRQQLRDYLQYKRILFLLDGFEQFPDATEFITDVIKTAPEIKIIVTSRERLRLQNEQLFPIQGLDFSRLDASPAENQAGVSAEDDPTQLPAVKLFLQGARRVRPGYEADAQDVPAIVHICRLVNGMPLAILLAAAWMETLNPAEIAVEISQGLDFLETDLSDVPERHRSVRAIFDYSWNLLSDQEKRLFCRLSVFRGGFSRAAAQQVGESSLQLLITLVNKFLLYRDANGRYEINTLLGQYGAEQLARHPEEEKTARQQHAQFYWAALAEYAADLKGARAEAALAELDLELENVRQAWNWMIAQGHLTGLSEAADCLANYYRRRGRFQEGEKTHRQAAERLASLMAQTTGPSDELVRALSRELAWQSQFSQATGQHELAARLIQEAAALLEKLAAVGRPADPEKALVLQQMGSVARFAGRREEARRLYEESMSLYRSLADPWGEAASQVQLGWETIHLGAYHEAYQLLNQTLQLYRSLGNKYGIAFTLLALGVSLLYQGQFEEARPLMQEALQIFRAIQVKQGVAQVLSTLGETAKLSGRFGEAKSLLTESAEHLADLGSHFGVIQIRLLASQADLHLGQYDEVEAQVQANLSLSQNSRFPVGTALSLFLLGCLKLVREDPVEASQLLAESADIYRQMKQRDELSWCLAAASYAAQKVKNMEQARSLLQEALAIGLEIRGFVPLVLALPSAALFLAGEGQVEQAVELFALVDRQPLFNNSCWFKELAGRQLESLQATLPPETAAAARVRGSAADLWESAGIVLRQIETAGHT